MFCHRCGASVGSDGRFCPSCGQAFPTATATAAAVGGVPLIQGALIALRMLALIIPTLVIAAMYKFTYLFIVDKRMEFWPAMQASHNVVKNDDFGFTMFLILAFFVNVLGFLCLIVGLLVTAPVTFAAITIAYKELVGSISGRRTVDRRSYLRSGSAKTYSALPVAG